MKLEKIGIKMKKEELIELKQKLLSANKQTTGNPYIDRPWEKGKSIFETNPIIPSTNIYNIIKLINLSCKDSIAIDCMDLRVSYGKMLEDAVQISLAIKELGIKKGDVVGVCMPNLYQAVAIFFACNRIGAVTTFINSSATNKELCDYLDLYESKVLFNYDSSVEQNEEIKKNTKLEYIVTLDKKNMSNISLNEKLIVTKNDSLINYNGLGGISKFQKKKIETIKGNDDALILYTSGTTGQPKSVVLTNKNIVASGIYNKNSALDQSSIMEGKSTLVCVPFTYPYGFCTSAILSLLSSKTTILGPNLSKDTIGYYMDKKPNIIMGSPALLELIMRNIPKDKDLSSVTTFVSGGDFLSQQNWERGINFFKEHGAEKIEISNGSGNAETMSCGTSQTGIKVKPETVGKPLVGVKCMIVDPETMEQKNIGEEGMLCVSGKHVFKEYYKDPEKTREAKFMYDGREFFKTGTMGFFDEEGYFHLTGRLSRFYILSSLNKVYLDHVQSLVSSFDCIKDCAAVKVPDDDMLFVNKIYVELDDKYKAMPEQDVLLYISDKCLQNNAKENNGEELMWYEIPKYIEIVDSLPRKQGTDKIDYSLLEKDAAEKHSKKKNIVLIKK